MTTLTIELPETLTEQLQAYGISQQQVQNFGHPFNGHYNHSSLTPTLRIENDDVDN